jgi:hypothetical protein
MTDRLRVPYGSSSREERVVLLTGLVVCSFVAVMAFRNHLPDLRQLLADGHFGFVVIDLFALSVVCVATSLPYWLSLHAIRITGFGRLFAASALIVACVNLKILHGEFFPPMPVEGGASMAVSVLPFYLALPVLMIWGVLRLVRR